MRAAVLHDEIRWLRPCGTRNVRTIVAKYPVAALLIVRIAVAVTRIALFLTRFAARIGSTIDPQSFAIIALE